MFLGGPNGSSSDNDILEGEQEGVIRRWCSRVDVVLGCKTGGEPRHQQGHNCG